MGLYLYMVLFDYQQLNNFHRNRVLRVIVEDKKIFQGKVQGTLPYFFLKNKNTFTPDSFNLKNNLYLCTKFNEILYANGQIKDKTT